MDEHQRHLVSMRAMAWQRAKGELRSMLETYWGDELRFNTLSNTIEAFIKDVEDNGKHE